MLSLDDEQGRVEGLVIIEMDDLFEAGGAAHRKNMESLAKKLQFGKMSS